MTTAPILWVLLALLTSEQWEEGAKHHQSLFMFKATFTLLANVGQIRLSAHI